MESHSRIATHSRYSTNTGREADHFSLCLIVVTVWDRIQVFCPKKIAKPLAHRCPMRAWIGLCSLLICAIGTTHAAEPGVVVFNQVKKIGDAAPAWKKLARDRRQTAFPDRLRKNPRRGRRVYLQQLPDRAGLRRPHPGTRQAVRSTASRPSASRRDQCQ